MFRNRRIRRWKLHAQLACVRTREHSELQWRRKFEFLLRTVTEYTGGLPRIRWRTRLSCRSSTATGARRRAEEILWSSVSLPNKSLLIHLEIMHTKLVWSLRILRAVFHGENPFSLSSVSVGCASSTSHKYKCIICILCCETDLGELM